MSLAPIDVIHTYRFYLKHLLNPALVLFPLIGMAAVWRNRAQLITSCAFLVAGLAAFIPHSILPNHLDAEYAWLGAPLFLAPMLLIGQPPRRKPSAILKFTLAAVVAAFVIIGPRGYQAIYRTPQERWFVNEDRKGSAMVESLRRLHGIHGPARVLVTGLEDTAIPWESGDFIHSEFGDQILWSVVLPESINYRRSSRLAEFPHGGDVKLGQFDQVVTYSSSGKLVEIRPVAVIPADEVPSEVIVPPLVKLFADVREHPNDPGPLMACAQKCLDWGLWTQAQDLLSEAKQKGAPDQSVVNLDQELKAALTRSAETSREATLAARPQHVVQPDGSGVGEVELSWTVPEGVAAEIHIDSPDGKLFTVCSGAGHARTGKWVNNGMRFFLQDVSGGKPLTSEHTLAEVKVEVSR